MRKVPLIHLCVCTAVVFGFASTAFAAAEGEPAEALAPAEVAPPAAAPLPPPLPTDEAGQEGEFKNITLTGNPLSIIFTRFSINFEYMLAQHHGLILVPSIWTMSASAGETESSFKYLGAELGYHFYTGEVGANGFFIGPSLVYMNLNVKDTYTDINGTTISDSASSSLYGFAVDFGGQYISKSGFTIGGGAGLMWVKVASKNDNSAEPTIKVSGSLPRVLFTIGYSF